MTHSYTNKRLIVNGCSFTDGKFDLPIGSYTWANVVGDHFASNLIYENIAKIGNSNDIIIPHTIRHIKQIDKRERVIAIIQLTALDRIVVDGKKSPTVGSALKSLNWMQWAMSRNEPVDGFWQNYFANEYSEEKHIDSFISRLLDFQHQIKECPNVDYRIFCGWDILTQNNKGFDMWGHKDKYENKNDNLISELYKDVHKKFKQLNLNKFWFFENEKINYGGLSQWAQYNVPEKHWYRNALTKDYHPSDYAHKKFAEDIMIPLIKKML